MEVSAPRQAPIPSALDGERLDRVVALVADVSRAEAARWLAEERVQVDGRVVVQASTRLRAGQVVAIDEPPPSVPGLVAEPSVDVTVVYEDASVIVVDKPAGVVVHPGSGTESGTLVHGLLARYPEIAEVGEAHRPGIVHRLDRGTSGLLVVARTASAYEALVEALARHDVEREYLAVVWGTVDADRGVIDAPIARSLRDPTRMAVADDGKPARTHYEVVQRASEPAPVTVLACRLETGRTHQIRVHLAAIGHPVVGDHHYRGARTPALASRPMLHARRLAFVHPATGEPVAFEAPVPADLGELLGRLR